MTIDDQIRVEKLQHDINTEAAKISPLSSGTMYKYEYYYWKITGEEVLLSNQKQIVEQAKFTCSPLGKPLKTKTKVKNKLML